MPWLNSRFSVLWVSAYLLAPVSTSWADIVYQVHGEMGPGVDSNALRTFSTDVDADGQPIPSRVSGLLRGSVGGNFELFKERFDMALRYDLGGKLFWQNDSVSGARAADELVQRASASWSLRFAAAKLALSLGYYDIFQRDDVRLAFARRDFRDGNALLRLSWSIPQWRAALSAHAGWQGLQYKPDADLSYIAALAGLSAHWRPVSAAMERPFGLALNAAYTVAARFYSGAAFAHDDQGNLVSTAVSHRDLDHRVRLGIRHTGLADLSLWYALAFNDSNTAGWSYQRHSVGLSFTTPVVWAFFLSASGVFRVSAFRDGVAPSVQQQLRADDENRTRIGITLSRALSEQWTVGARYNVYVSEATRSAQPDGSAALRPRHLRHTAGAFVQFEFGNQ